MNVIRETCKYQKARWCASNKELHGAWSKSGSSAATKLALVTRIQAMYSHETNRLVQDQTPFNIDIADWEHKSRAAMKQWLNHSTPHIKQALILAKEQLKKNASNIRPFLPTTPSTNRTQTKTKWKKAKPKSKDVRQYTKNKNGARITRPNPQQARIRFPKQYKQATLFAYVEARTQPTTAKPTTQNTSVCHFLWGGGWNVTFNDFILLCT